MKIFNTCSSASNKKRKSSQPFGRCWEEKRATEEFRSVGEKPNSLQEELPRVKPSRKRVPERNRERSLQCCGAKIPEKVVLESFSQELTDYSSKQLFTIILRRQSKNVFARDNVKSTREAV